MDIALMSISPRQRGSTLRRLLDQLLREERERVRLVGVIIIADAVVFAFAQFTVPPTKPLISIVIDSDCSFDIPRILCGFVLGSLVRAGRTTVNRRTPAAGGRARSNS
jgi:hypothetical protein